ncbi:MAG: response regulator, partial [Desulfobacula sp.]|nr:response regulator [Desulfobacula sp.]
GTETILMIDDEKDILSVTKVFFEQYGYHVLTFTDGIQAFEAFNEKPDQFDLIITDMTMPKITGDKLATKILNIRPDIPIILCTGYSHKISKEEARDLGIRQYIEKPIVLKDLIVSVRKTLDEK